MLWKDEHKVKFPNFSVTRWILHLLKCVKKESLNFFFLHCTACAVFIDLLYIFDPNLICENLCLFRWIPKPKVSSEREPNRNINQLTAKLVHAYWAATFKFKKICSRYFLEKNLTPVVLLASCFLFQKA